MMKTDKMSGEVWSESMCLNQKVLAATFDKKKVMIASKTLL